MIKPTIWLEARERSAYARERYRQEVLVQVHAVLQSLAEKYTWDELYLFGSLIAPGRFTCDSDIDMGISGLDKHDLLSFIAEASRELSQDVDVLRLEESKIADSIRRKGAAMGTKMRVQKVILHSPEVRYQKSEVRKNKEL